MEAIQIFLVAFLAAGLIWNIVNKNNFEEFVIDFI